MITTYGQLTPPETEQAYEEFEDFKKRYPNAVIKDGGEFLVFNDWLEISNPWNGCFDVATITATDQYGPKFKALPEYVLHLMIECHEE